MECAGDEVGTEVEELVEVEFVAELQEFNCLAARHGVLWLLRFYCYVLVLADRPN
jgi:hypothetical protein